jgi:TonB family protein
VAVPQSKPIRSGKIPAELDRHPYPEWSSSAPAELSEHPDEENILSSLKEFIAGEQSLDLILGTITDVARQLTGASGAALAMWKDGAMVCRARTGDLAPVLGAHLNAKTGISGECLRTGKMQHCADTENNPLVDLEVCRSLGLRSIAVLPIRGGRAINGILEVFSTRPAVFTEQHIVLLQKLATLAERARTSQLESAPSAAPPLRSELQKTQSRFRTKSDRGADLARVLHTRSRLFILGAMGIVVISLLAVGIWLGLLGPGRAGSKAPPAPSSTNMARVGTGNPRSDTAATSTLDLAIGQPPDNDPVWKANPGGESLSPSTAKSSAGSAVKFASKVDAEAGNKITPDRAQDGLRSPDVAANVVVKYGLPDSPIESKTGSQPESRSNLQSDATSSAEPLPTPAGSTNSYALNGVLSAKVSLPGLAPPVSQGVSGGQLVHSVFPVYPAQARALRLEGRVVLDAVIAEDGTLRDIKVVEGPSLLAQSAVDAVQQWRYKPYEIDGKPVKNEIRIKVDFKFPAHAASR